MSAMKCEAVVQFFPGSFACRAGGQPNKEASLISDRRPLARAHAVKKIHSTCDTDHRTTKPYSATGNRRLQIASHAANAVAQARLHITKEF